MEKRKSSVLYKCSKSGRNVLFYKTNQMQVSLWSSNEGKKTSAVCPFAKLHEMTKIHIAVIKKLIKLLDSDDENTQAVACFDLGEFSRLHPFSK